MAIRVTAPEFFQGERSFWQDLGMGAKVLIFGVAVGGLGLGVVWIASLAAR